ncbi:MAG: hypothetical protein R6V45_12335, partial [Oceanipulchritudo sp.]
LACFLAAIFMGYTREINPVFLAVLPLGFIFGQVIQRSARSSRIFRSRGPGLLLELILLYVMAALVAGFGLAIGFGVAEVLAHRPPA